MVSISESSDRVKYRNTGRSQNDEIFEITDFTTASDWERFIARLEDTVHDFKLSNYVPETNFPKGAFASGSWTTSSTDISDVPDFEFNIKRTHLQQSIDSDEPASLEKNRVLSRTAFSADQFPAVLEQMLSTDNDFPVNDSIPPLALWFGISEFLVVSPSAFNELDKHPSESRLKVVLSSVSIAIANAKCTIPVFVQFGDPSRNIFHGAFESLGYRTTFDVIDLERIPDRWRTFVGLLDIFKEKIGYGSDAALIKASIQLTVKLNPDSVEGDDRGDDGASMEKKTKLCDVPFGPLEYDGFLIYLFASWPNANAEAIEDSLTHSDLDPCQAPTWSLQLVLNDKATYALTEALRNFAKQTNRHETIQSLLDYLDPEIVEADGRSRSNEVLSKLTGDPKAHLSNRVSKVLHHSLPKYHLPVPIDIESMNEILAYLFPDSDLAKGSKKTFSCLTESSTEDAKRLKAAPLDSLASRVALSLWYVFEKFGGALAAAYLWQEVMLDLRYRWENCHLIPGVGEGPPDFSTCLLYQKLQMLNCCISKRKNAMSANAVDSNAESAGKAHQGRRDSESSEDEFFDCQDDFPESSKDPTAKKPEGRLHQLGSVTLLRYPEIPLYVPQTQEPAPMTEDAVFDHLEFLASTDDTEEGRAERAKLQSAALVSDMSAFKAANPGCIFEDFVRWHSPRDWEENSNGQEGRLSDRMSLPGSVWLDAWDAAEPKSARRQKRLFDERVEAEKALLFFNTTLGDVFRQLLPVFVRIVLTKLEERMSRTELQCPYPISDLFRSASRIFSSPTFSYVEFEKLLRSLRLNEQLLSCNDKLQESIRTSNIEDNDQSFSALIRDLVQTRSLLKVPGGARSPVGSKFVSVFRQRKDGKGSTDSPKDPFLLSSLKNQLPQAAVKEFILRTVAPRPYRFSRPGVHRMYVCLKPNEVRIAGAFTEDLLNG